MSRVGWSASRVRVRVRVVGLEGAHLAVLLHLADDALHGAVVDLVRPARSE